MLIGKRHRRRMDTSVDEPLCYIHIRHMVFLKIVVRNHALMHTHTIMRHIKHVSYLNTHLVCIENCMLCHVQYPLVHHLKDVGVGPDHDQEVAEEGPYSANRILASYPDGIAPLFHHRGLADT